MISHFELRHIIEGGFLPTKCFCSISQLGTLSIQLMNPQTHEIELTVPGIPLVGLETNRGINDLIAQIREEYKLVKIAKKERRRLSR